MMSLKSELNSSDYVTAAPLSAVQFPDAAFLEHISKGAQVEHFRCQYCGHVWNTPKHDPEGSLATSHRCVRRKQIKSLIS
jgi:hypothetical protein